MTPQSPANPIHKKSITEALQGRRDKATPNIIDPLSSYKIAYDNKNPVKIQPALTTIVTIVAVTCKIPHKKLLPTSPESFIVRVL